MVGEYTYVIYPYQESGTEAIE